MRRAYLVGCRAYDDQHIANLDYSDQDARRFATALRTVGGFDADGLSLIADGQPAGNLPTRANVLRALTSVDDQSVDLLIFFFSGHGFQSAGDGRDYLVMADTVSGALEDTGIAVDRLVTLLRKQEARHTIVFIDACRAQAAAGKALPGSLVPLELASVVPEGLITFHSCRSGQSSFESPDIQSGVFTHGLLQALSDDGRCKTVYELNSYMTAYLPKLCASLNRPRQDPWSHIEPMGAEHVSLVSEEKRHEWTANTPLGRERRAERGPTATDIAGFSLPAVCALDFGTTYSAIAVIDARRIARLVPDSSGRVLIPSVVTFDAAGDYEVGWRAISAAADRPELSLAHIKRQLGQPAPFAMLGRTVTPEFAASLIIGSLKRNAEDYVGASLRDAIVSYPANFTYLQANALIRACEWAGFRVFRAVTEPSAAAVLTADLLMAEHAPDVDWDVNKVALVVDLGGGTLDVCLVDADGGGSAGFVLEIIAAFGADLGGCDYDSVLAERLLRHLRAHIAPWREPSARELHQARLEAERVKVQLNTSEVATMMLLNTETAPGTLEDLQVTVTRDEFREETRGLTTRIRGVIEQVLGGRDGYAQRVWDEKGEYVVLSGQASKLFVVRELITGLDLNATVIDRYQDNAVTLGLVSHVQSLYPVTGPVAAFSRPTTATHLLLQERHRSIGLRCQSTRETNDAVIIVIGKTADNQTTYSLIPPSTTIPTLRVVTVETTQSEVEVVVVEGGMLTDDEHAVATIPVGGLPTFEVRIEIDVDSTAIVSVREPGATNDALAVQLNNPHLSPGASRPIHVAKPRLTPLVPDVDEPEGRVDGDGQTE